MKNLLFFLCVIEWEAMAGTIPTYTSPEYIESGSKSIAGETPVQGFSDYVVTFSKTISNVELLWSIF